MSEWDIGCEDRGGRERKGINLNKQLHNVVYKLTGLLVRMLEAATGSSAGVSVTTRFTAGAG